MSKTTKGLMDRLMAITANKYDQQLQAMNVTGKRRECFLGGFSDGMRSMLGHLTHMELIEIVPEPESDDDESE